MSRISAFDPIPNHFSNLLQLQLCAPEHNQFLVAFVYRLPFHPDILSFLDILKLSFLYLLPCTSLAILPSLCQSCFLWITSEIG